MPKVTQLVKERTTVQTLACQVSKSVLFIETPGFSPSPGLVGPQAGPRPWAAVGGLQGLSSLLGC